METVMQEPIDVTNILAQPRDFADRLARVERERAELIETVARLRAECNDAQAVARAYILRAERAEADVERLTAALHAYTDVYGTNLLLRGQPAHDCRATCWRADEGLHAPECPNKPASAQGRCFCGHTEGLHDNHGLCGECACDKFKPMWGTAPAQADQLDDESMRLLDETVAALSRPIPAERECTCEHVMDGDDVAYTIRDRSCPMRPAPAQGQRQDASDNEIFGPAFAPRKAGGEARP